MECPVKRFLIALIAVIALSAGALVIGPGFVDWNRYKPQILAQLQAATGHDYAIGGPLEFAVLPYPRLRIQDLAVSAPGGKGGPLLALKETAVSVDLLPLLKGKVVVSSVLLVQPRIEVSVGADGTPSWMTPVLKEKTAAGSGGAAGQGDLMNAVTLREVRIRDGQVRYTDLRTGKTLALDKITVSLQGDTFLGPYTLDGTVGYLGQDVDLKVKTGRMDNLSESLALQVQAKLGKSGSSLEYSGVAALKDQPEFQGEASFETAGLGDLAGTLGGSKGGAGLPAQFDRPLKAKGLVTFSSGTLSCKNLALSFGGMEAEGTVSASGLSGKGGGIVLSAALTASGPFDLDPFLPSAQKKKEAAGTRPDAFLPEALALPDGVDFSLAFKAPSVKYKGEVFSGAALALEKKQGVLSVRAATAGPGGTDMDVNASASFASSSKSAQDGTAVLSDPVVTADVRLVSDEPAKFASLFLTKDQSSAAAGLFSHGLSAGTARISLKGKKMDFNAAGASLLGTKFDSSGSYTLRTGKEKDLLALALSSPAVDLDRWIKAFSRKGAAAAMPETASAPSRGDAGKAVAAFARSLNLPFDLALDASFGSVRIEGVQYDKLDLKTRIEGNALHIETASVQDAAGNALSVTGDIGDVAALKQLNLTVSGATPDLEKLLGSYKVDTANLPKNVGAAEMVSEFRGDSSKLDFKADMKALRGSLAASGSLSSLMDNPSVSTLALRLRHPSYVELVRIFNPSFSSGVAISKTLDISGAMAQSGNRYDFTGIKAALGSSVITGNVSVAAKPGARPAVEADLSAGDLPLDELMGVQAGRKGAVQADRIRNPGSSGVGGGDVRWSRNAIDAGWMNAFDMNLKAKADTLSWGNWILKGAAADLVLKDGTMDIGRVDAGLFGGRVFLKGRVSSSQKPRQPLSISSSASLSDVPVEDFVRAFSGSPLVRARGVVSFKSDLDATGLSPAALVFDLHGKASLSGKDIVFEGFDLARLSRALGSATTSARQNFSTLLGAATAGGTTRFDTLDGTFTVAEGVINIDRLLLTGQAADVANTGSVSLPLWTIDMASEVRLKEPADAPPLKVSFRGPLDNPAQTFGQSAMEAFFQKQIEGMVVDPLLKNLDKSGTLQQILGTGGQPSPSPSAPSPTPSSQRIEAAPLAPSSSGTGAAAPEDIQPSAQPQEAPPQQQPPQQQKQQKPEDVLKGVLGDFLQQQLQQQGGQR